jgi:secretion/DNA translocation related CpaE-like protein
MTATTKPAGPLLVTRDLDLREQLLRLCAAAAVTPDVQGDVGLARRGWLAAACVLVGADCAEEVAALAMPRRDDVCLVAPGPERAKLWRDGVAIRADHVAVLPESEAALVGRLADTVEGGGETAVTVAVVGARGGVGASTLAAALGLTAARRGVDALLVDADGFGGGIELVVGCESEPGLRWTDVASTQGRVSAAAMRAALPSVAGLSVLSWRQRDPAGMDGDALTAVLTAARRGCDVVILDLPRHLDETATAAVMAVETVVLVATPDVGSTAAAGRLLGLLNPICADVRLVVRQLRGTAIVPELVATTLGIPLVATVPTRRAVSRSIQDGLGPLCGGRIARVCSRLLDDLGVHPRQAA